MSQNEMSQTTDTLDARGEKCPIPVLRTEKRLARMAQGETLIVLATDPMARIDIVLFCRQNGHAVEMSDNDGIARFEIVAGGASDL